MASKAKMTGSNGERRKSAAEKKKARAA